MHPSNVSVEHGSPRRAQRDQGWFLSLFFVVPSSFVGKCFPFLSLSKFVCSAATQLYYRHCAFFPSDVGCTTFFCWSSLHLPRCFLRVSSGQSFFFELKKARAFRLFPLVPRACCLSAGDKLQVVWSTQSCGNQLFVPLRSSPSHVAYSPFAHPKLDDRIAAFAFAF